MDKWLGEARRRAAQVGEVLKDAAFDLSWDLRDSAKTGFGLPKLVSSVASLGVATVAAAGAASVAFDLTGKVFGKRECETCNGWESMRCTMCRGSGKVQYNINESSLTDAEKSNPRSVAAAALEGRAQIEYISDAVKLGLALPFKDCPSCDATGVILCTSCDGDSWKPKLNFDNVMNAPWQSWNAYRKIHAPTDEISNEVVADPAFAAYSMFGRAEVEGGFQFDDEVKEKLMMKYHEARQYDDIRELVAKREPGWELMQEALFAKDPERAARDPVIVANPAHFQARLKVEAEVNELPIPPRPAQWMSNVKKPLKESDWSKEDLKNPRAKSEMEVLLQGQEQFYNRMLDTSWEEHWRDQKVEEIIRERIDGYERGNVMDSYESALPEAIMSHDIAGDASSTASPIPTQVKPTVEKKKSDPKRRPDDDRKKKERQERAERMARQAAEREAALAKAKAARERKGGS